MRLHLLLPILALAACSAPDGGDVLDRLELTSEQRAVADAFVEGQLAASPLGMLRQRDYLYAGCYAKEVAMPSRYRAAHLAYLANYTEADEDYYGFFAGYGLDEEQAYAVFERFETADGKCSI